MAWQNSVLVVANVTADSPELLAALKVHSERGACRFTLLVPAAAAGKEGREAAQERLDQALVHMREAGLEIEGRVGDPDPVSAVHDAWDPMKFDEVVISTLPTGTSKWLQVDLPHRVEKLTGVGVQHVVAQPPRPAPRTEPAPEHEDHGVLAPLAAALGGRRKAT
jgi:hypothetical protein